MKLMKTSVAMLAAAAVIIITGSLIQGVNPEFVYYKNPLFLIFVAAFVVIQVICLIGFRPRLRKIGFYIGHIGLVVVIVGSFVSFFALREVNFNIPVTSDMAYSIVEKEDGSEIDFGFSIQVPQFHVEKYDPDYQLITLDDREPLGYRVVEETVIADRKGIYHLGEGRGNISRGQLMEGDTFIESCQLPDGLILVKLPQADKSYDASLRILDGEETREANLRVNHPHTYRGWKFYLMDYDRDMGQTVSLYAKHDPGNLIIRTGIWMLIVGIALMCLRIFDRKEGQKNGTC